MISVVIPLYQKASTIRRAVESVCAQTYRPLEVIVIDDGSTDEGAARLANAPGISIVRQQRAGAAAARNRGAELARGELVAFLDADDEWDPWHLADIADAAERFPQAVAIGTAFRRVDPRGRVRALALPPHGDAPYLIADYFAFCAAHEPALCSSSVAVRRVALLACGGFPEGVAQGEDLVTWARLACRGAIAMCPRVSATYHLQAAALATRRRPAEPDAVAELLACLGPAHGLARYRGDWHRIRAALYSEVDDRLACLRELGNAIAASGPRAKDALLALSLLVPAPQRERMFAGYRRVVREGHPVRWLAARAYAELAYTTGLCRLHTINRGSYRVRFSPSAMAFAMWTDPDYWADEEAFFRAHVAPGDFVVDVGANIGANALLAATLVGPGGRVVAFEAHPQTCRYLRRNVALNGAANVIVEHHAVGEHSGSVRISRHVADDSQHHVVDRDGVDVPACTLDELLARYEGVVIDLLKVDVEGYDLQVFRGAPQTLARTRAIYFEVDNDNFARFGYRTHDVLAFLGRHGFEDVRIGGCDGERVPTDFSPPRCLNLYARRSDRGN